MKNISRKALSDLAGDLEIHECEQVAHLSQNTNQYDNYALTIRKLPDGTHFLHEDQLSASEYYLLDEASDPAQRLRDCALDWSLNCDDRYDLERIAWGLMSANDIEVAEDYEGACKIIIESHYYGHEPVDYVKNEKNDVMVLETVAAAKAWIDAEEDGTYYLSHNEIGRPAYTIVEA